MLRDNNDICLFEMAESNSHLGTDFKFVDIVSRLNHFPRVASDFDDQDGAAGASCNSDACCFKDFFRRSRLCSFCAYVT